MCGRYTLRNPDQMALRFDAVEDGAPDHQARYNVAPSQQIPVVVADGDRRVITRMRWGFQPQWMDQASSKRPAPINARAETLLQRPLFRTALLRQRCLIPADGFYEWQERAGRRKQPYFARLRDGDLFGFAGIYTPGPDGEGTASCAIITTTPNGLMAPIHDRMPAILLPDAEALWLDPGVDAADPLLSCLHPYPDDRMEVYPVSPLVSSVRNEGPDLIAPLVS